jgi:micrococcal nuclease
MARRYTTAAMKRLISAAIVLNFFLLPLLALAEDFSGRVVAVTDGDTIRVLRNRREVRVRLYGVDAPESKQPFGSRAKQFTSGLVFGKAVTVRVRDVDRYGRTVGEVILPDGRNLNQEIVKAGFACGIASMRRTTPH